MGNFFKKFGNKKYDKFGKVISGDKDKEKVETATEKMVREANEAAESRRKKKEDKDSYFEDGGVAKKSSYGCGGVAKKKYSKLKKYLGK